MRKSAECDINLVADYLCYSYLSRKQGISVALLHKLLYFTQAWYLAQHGHALFENDFEAWVYGPVCPDLNERFRFKPKGLNITAKEIDLDTLNKLLPPKIEAHVNQVLSYYYGMTVIQLEEIFGSNEVPWRHARSEMRSTTRGNNIIPKTEIMNHYRTLKHVIHSA